MSDSQDAGAVASVAAAAGLYPGALAGVRVVDFTHVISGPFATQILADLGAEVIKVEDTREGDVSRALGPHKNGLSHHFGSFNRNKRSIALDLKSQPGRQAAEELIRRADVLVENFAPGVIERLGFGVAACRALNARLIYCSISGFGQTGPWAHKRSLDVVAQAYAGVISTTGTAEAPPVKVGIPIGDTAVSVFAAVGIVAALYERQTTGVGKFLDLAMFDSLLTLLGNIGGHHHTVGTQPPRVGTGHYWTTPYGSFAAADGEVIIAAYTDPAWVGLCKALGVPECATDPRFATGPARAANRPQVFGIICPLMQRLPMAELLRLLEDNGVPCAPINSVAQALDNPHTEARQMVLHLQHPQFGAVDQTSLPLRDVMRASHHAPPAHGEHTAEILAELGLAPPPATFTPGN